MPQSRHCKPARRFRSGVLVEPVEQRTLLSAVLHPDAVYLRPAATSAAVTTTASPDDIDGLTPAESAKAYGFDTASFSSGSVAADGAGQTIAIVDAYNDPDIQSDLKVFDAAFDLAAPPSLKVVNQSGGTSLPATDADWAGEIALDVEWAHAMAPGANILLVETASDDTDDLIAGVNYARSATGVSVVTLSWGGSEFESFSGGGESATQTAYDADFTTPAGHRNVTFVAAAGDSGARDGVQWPASSPNVLSVGGTTLTTADDGTYESELGWAGTSSGASTVETRPAYQAAVNDTAYREVADVSYDGDPNTGFKVYDSLPDADDGETYAGWEEVGGTSAGAPQWAALIAIADQGRTIAGLSTLDGPTQTLPDLYDLYSAPDDAAGYASYTSYFNDVTSGGSGSAQVGRGGRRGMTSSNSAAAGYDVVTGLGTPKAAALIDDLATTAAVTGGTGTTANGSGSTGTSSGGSTDASETVSPVTVTVLDAPVASAVGGTAAVLHLRLTNTGTTAFSGPITLSLYASTDGTAAGEVGTLASVTLSRVTLRANASRSVAVKYDYPTDLPTGSYTLIVSADATATDTTPTTAVTPAVAVAAPSVDLSVAFAGTTAVTVKPGKKAHAVVRVTNVGNVTATGPVTVALSAVTTDGTAVPLETVTRKVKVVAGRVVSFGLPFAAPADLPAGTYSLVATVTSTTSPSDADTANNSATAATQA